MWIACSPGGRFCRLSLIFTPWAAADRVAVPTLPPWASCRFTIFGAGVLAPLAKADVTARKIMVVSIAANLGIFGVIILQVPHFLLHVQVATAKIVSGFVPRRSPVWFKAQAGPPVRALPILPTGSRPDHGTQSIACLGG